jgi:hypothetical protein
MRKKCGRIRRWLTRPRILTIVIKAHTNIYSTSCIAAALEGLSIAGRMTLQSPPRAPVGMVQNNRLASAATQPSETGQARSFGGVRIKSAFPRSEQTYTLGQFAFGP